jgi:hypothetical protein
MATTLDFRVATHTSLIHVKVLRQVGEHRLH